MAWNETTLEHLRYCLTTARTNWTGSATGVGTVNRNRDPPTFGVFITSQEHKELFFRRKWPIYVAAARLWSRTRLPIIQSATKRKDICLSSDGRRSLTDSNRFGTHYPELPQKHTQGSVHTQPNERTVRGCKNEQHRNLSYNLAVLAKPYFCSKWSQYTTLRWGIPVVF
jgi:hypothetical protein